MKRGAFCLEITVRARLKACKMARPTVPIAMRINKDTREKWVLGMKTAEVESRVLKNTETSRQIGSLPGRIRFLFGYSKSICTGTDAETFG
jgi:hypothetical protein